MNINKSQGRKPEQGSALVYILIAIALLAALTFTFMEPSSQQTSSQNTFKSASALHGQVDMIRASIQECVLSYPTGDTTIDITTGTGTDPDARTNWPINPNSDHYATATPGKSGDRLVRNIRCPGDNPGVGSEEDHSRIFSGSSGKFLPPAADLFDDWQYYNGVDGIFFWTETDKTDAFITTALTKVDNKFAECEADIIDTSHPAAGAKDLDSLGIVTCTANHICFRVWMITNGSAVFNGDEDGEEAACP
ncbi:MAG: hypothetical protein KAJ86_05570 [Alphaproteobacteria bacterium]|nr:hypothetical protein [Alphaproteobacteria bacterium]